MSIILLQARTLRKKLTDTEQLLWYSLRKRQIRGLRFRRQVPLGTYIVDFLCYEARLIIELDGGQHNESEQLQYDMQRTQWLERQGYRVQRFWNNEVLEHLDDVLETVWQRCQEYRSDRNSTPHPVLPPQGGKGRSN
jgi:very-short-patch-repair endonuclease